jgi:hypothetical protein
MMHKFLVQIDDHRCPGFPAEETARWLQTFTATHFALYANLASPVSVTVIQEEREPDICPVTIPDDKFFSEENMVRPGDSETTKWKKTKAQHKEWLRCHGRL